MSTRSEAEVNSIMDIPMDLTKGRDGWEAVSMVHIPGRPELGDAENITHVRVVTGKASRGGLYTSATEVGKTAHGFACIMDFHEPKPWERLGESPDRCTEESVALLHRLSLAKLLELRPELKGATQEAPMPDALGLAVQPEDRADASELGRKEPDATGEEGDDEDDNGRFLPVVTRTAHAMPVGATQPC